MPYELVLTGTRMRTSGSPDPDCTLYDLLQWHSALAVSLTVGRLCCTTRAQIVLIRRALHRQRYSSNKNTVLSVFYIEIFWQGFSFFLACWDRPTECLETLCVSSRLFPSHLVSSLNGRRWIRLEAKGKSPFPRSLLWIKWTQLQTYDLQASRWFSSGFTSNLRTYNNQLIEKAISTLAHQ